MAAAPISSIYSSPIPKISPPALPMITCSSLMPIPEGSLRRQTYVSDLQRAAHEARQKISVKIDELKSIIEGGSQSMVLTRSFMMPSADPEPAFVPPPRTLTPDLRSSQSPEFPPAPPSRIQSPKQPASPLSNSLPLAPSRTQSPALVTPLPQALRVSVNPPLPSQSDSSGAIRRPAHSRNPSGGDSNSVGFQIMLRNQDDEEGHIEFDLRVNLARNVSTFRVLGSVMGIGGATYCYIANETNNLTTHPVLTFISAIIIVAGIAMVILSKNPEPQRRYPELPV